MIHDLLVRVTLPSQSQLFQVKLSALTLCMPFSFPPTRVLACRLPLFGLFPWRFTLWVREQQRTELRWGMALSDHHYTSPPFHLHLIILISPWERVRPCVLAVIRLYVHAVKWKWMCVRQRKKDERRGRESKVRSYDTAITPHAGSICTLLFVSLLEKKQVIYPAWRGSWSLFPWHAFVCVCTPLYVRPTLVCTHVRYIHSDSFLLVRNDPFGAMNWGPISLKNILTAE